MFCKKLCVAAALGVFSLSLIAGEAVPTPPKPEAPAKPKTIEEIVDAIPAGPLEDGVILQTGTIKVPSEMVDRVESAYVVSEKKRQPKFTLTPELKNYLRRRFAMRFLVNSLVEKYATDNKLEVPKEVFDEHFAKFKDAKKQEGGSYEQWLADNGLSDDEFRKFWSANLAIEKSFEKQVSEKDIDDAFAKYSENIPLRRCSHILFMYKGSERAPTTVTRTKEEAKASADDMLKKLAAGEDFAKLAQGNSDCPSKAKGGDLNFFPRKGAMAEPFADATYKLEKVGDYTPAPVETSFGYHIIKLTEMRKTDDLKKDMKQHLINEKFNGQLQKIVEDASKDAKFNEKQL